MKLLSFVLFGFSVQNRLPIGTDSSELAVQRNAKIYQILDTARAIGQVGCLASEEDQRLIEKLTADAIPLSESRQPAKYPLTGVHRLVYSAAKGASSGRVFGNVVGKVTQLFEDDEIFYNRVNFGPLQISLRARRKVMNDTTIKVSFLETSFNLFGKTISKKEVGGGGVWKVKFVGIVRSADGTGKLVRIMDTPSLFILVQDL
jgi:hypothetical protein